MLFNEVIKQSRRSMKMSGYLTMADGTEIFYTIFGEDESEKVTKRRTQTAWKLF